MMLLREMYVRNFKLVVLKNCLIKTQSDFHQQINPYTPNDFHDTF